MVVQFLRRHKYTILYGAGLAILLILLKWLEWRFIIFDHAIEVYSGAIAVLFPALGIWLAMKLARPNAITDTKTAETEPNPQIIAKLGLSARELEVLQLMAEGLSNQEIAARLFVSLNTIKTHSSRIFEKLDARRRTQAVEKARRLGLIGHQKV